MEENKTTGYSAEDARRMVAGDAGGRTAVIDLRGEDDFADGHIPSAVRLESPSRDDLDEIDRGRQEVETLLVVCEDGKRSREVAEQLGGEGVEVGWLEGGMSDWSGPTQPRDEIEFKGPQKKTLY
jgi:rhodanese-related sulfurtransferase